jgi:hypothetical protein
MPVSCILRCFPISEIKLFIVHAEMVYPRIKIKEKEADIR